MTQVDIDNVTNGLPDLDTLSIAPNWGTLDLSAAQGAIGSTAGMNGINTGYVYTTNGTGAIPSGGYNWNITTSTPTTLDQSGKLSLRGPNADIDIDGHSLSAWMTKVEERLNIMTPNPELEKEWDELRRLGDRYRRLEKKCQDKAAMWNKLKKITPSTKP